MGEENGGVSGPSGDKGSSTRVGSAEREAAVSLLEGHWRAGRLDPGEHELRVARARVAVTQADLDALFTDLPEPAPAARPPAGRVPNGTVPVGGSGGFLEGKRETIMALTPFAALILFFVTGSWLWFLMVPVMGILVYGPGGKKNPRGKRRP